MSYFCALAMDDCFDDTWDCIVKDNYSNFSISFTDSAISTHTGEAVANYCRITLKENIVTTERNYIVMTLYVKD